MKATQRLFSLWMDAVVCLLLWRCIALVLFLDCRTERVLKPLRIADFSAMLEGQPFLHCIRPASHLRRMITMSPSVCKMCTTHFVSTKQLRVGTASTLTPSHQHFLLLEPTAVGGTA